MTVDCGCVVSCGLEESDQFQPATYRKQPPRRPSSRLVADTLRFLAGGWLKDEEDTEWCLETADLIEAYDFDEGGWTCPLCQEVVCDGGCPLEGLREV